MDFPGLLDDLVRKRGAIHTFEKGTAVRRSYQTLHDDMIAAHATLQSWGVTPGQRVGVFADNCYHWLVFDLALIKLGAISMAFTADFDGKLNDDLLDHYDISLLLVDKSHARQFPHLSARIASIDGPNSHVQALQTAASGAPDEHDQLSLVFSSGSAGGLKGLVISRKGVTATLPPLMDALGVKARDGLLLFLPMSNFQQRYLCYGALEYDFDIMLTRYTELFVALPLLKPTILLAPPIFFQMLHAEHLRLPAWKRTFRGLLGSALRALPRAALRRGVAQWAFGDFYRQFGVNIRILVTGMAPIQRTIALFFERMQLPLSEAYGMVEAGVMTYRPGGSDHGDSVGRPLRDVRFAFEEDGEIIVNRDHPVALRYFQCAAGENERTFIARGRIATGDIGRTGRDGHLHLLGRKKEILITAGGTKIHPETVEEELNNLPDVAHSVVFLGSNATQLSCVIALNNMQDEDAKTRVRKLATSIKAVRTIGPLAGVVFAEQPFTRENGMLRPNMKIDRRRIVAQYAP